MTDLQNIIVSESEMKKASSPDILESSYITSFIAIGFYDSKTKSGYICHNFGSDESIELHIQTLKDDYKKLTDLKVYLLGGSMASDFADEIKSTILLRRKDIESILKEHFENSNLNLNWLDEDKESKLFLNTKTGEFDTRINDII